jgi:FkbM family methyltransferase
LADGQTIVDLGANIGYYSIMASPIVGPRGRVYAFEPDPEMYEYLLRNVMENDLSNVTLVRKAAAANVASMAFIRSELERGHLAQTAQASSTSVDATTLDHYFASMGWPRVDLIKMDIEGGEAAALRGMKMLSARNPALRLVMEFNLTAMQRAGETPAGVASLLRELGFETGYVIEKGLQPVTISRGLPVSHALYNLLLTKEAVPGSPLRSSST